MRHILEGLQAPAVYSSLQRAENRPNALCKTGTMNRQPTVYRSALNNNPSSQDRLLLPSTGLGGPSDGVYEKKKLSTIYKSLILLRYFHFSFFL